MWASGGGGGSGPGPSPGPGNAAGVGGGPWPTEWPVNQNMYQNIPHDKIDWAALAQQWIQMRETSATARGAVDIPGGGGGGPPPPHLTGHGGGVGRGFDRNPILPGGPLPSQQQMMRMANTPLVTTSMPRDVHIPDNSHSQLDGAYGSPKPPPPPPPNPYWNPGSWGSNATGWVAPPPPSHPHPHPHPHPIPNLHPPSELQKGPVQTFDYGHVHGNQGYASQTYDYNHGTDQIGLNQSFVPDSQHFNQYWTSGGGGGGFPPPFLRRENTTDLLEHDDRSNIPMVDEYGQGPALDAAKRKNLPAWIREGLEKMEREKQKKIEREEMLKERERRLCAQREEDERNLAAFEAMKGREERETAVAPRRSKFESDSDDGSDSDLEGDDRKRERSPLRQESPSPYQPPKTEQEKMEDMMVRVRRLLTEVLLEVTNEEVNLMAKEVFSKARAKAPAQQLAKSSALASITGSFGYSSESDDETGADDDAIDSDAELEEVIRRRRLEFSQREKEFASSVYSDDVSQDDSADAVSRSRDEDLPQKTEKFVPAFLAPSPNGSKEQSDFEKKWYEAVPSLGTVGNCTEIQGDGPVVSSIANNNKLDTREAAVIESKNSPESDSTKSSRNSSSPSRSRHGEHDSPIGRHGSDSKRSRSRDRERSRDRNRSSRRQTDDRNRDRRDGRGHRSREDRARVSKRSYGRRSSRSASRDGGGGGSSSRRRRGRRRRSYSGSTSRSRSRDRYTRRRSRGDRRRRHSSSSSSSSDGSRSRSQTKRRSSDKRRTRNGGSRSRSRDK